MVDIGLIGGGVRTGMLVTPLLAQVNIGGTWSTLLGIALVGSGVGLYALRSMRPKLARDYDIFFAAVALLCGGILFFQGWRQDPILQFGQFLLTGSAIFFAIESIRLRGIATEQARRNAPIEDYDRPVSPIYEAALDDLDTFEERSRRPRIQPSRERSARDEYEEEPRQRRVSKRSSDDRLSSGSDRARKRRPRSDQPTADYTDYTDYTDYNESRGEPPDSEPRDSEPRDSEPRNSEPRGDRPSRTRTSPSTRGNQSPGSTRPRRTRPTDEPPVRRERGAADADSPSSEYADYRSVDDEEDNWS